VKIPEEYLCKLNNFESETDFNKRREIGRKQKQNQFQFQCSICLNIYDNLWADEEAMKECEDNFGVEMANNADNYIVCDDCYKQIDPKKHPQQVIMAQNEHFIKRN